MKLFRILIVLLAIAAIAASFAVFFDTEQKIKKMNEIKPQAEAMYAEWSAHNNCIEEPKACEAYSGQYSEWKLRFDNYRERKEQSPEFQFYSKLKEFDKEYAGELDHGGLASLSAASLALFFFAFLLFVLLKRKKKKPEPSKSRFETMPNLESAYKPRPKPELAEKPEPELKPMQKKEKPDAQALINKASECAESSPMQAISYLEQALESISDNSLRDSVLLLCGSLRVKNKIGESLGAEQLKKIIEASPQSSEAKEAEKILSAFK
jgi:hypothetical protein